MSWIVTSDNPDLLRDIKLYEGTIDYQKKLGYFRDNKFWVYKDTLGFPTIGYGHLLLEGERFPNGLSIEDADKMLAKDLESTINDAKSIYDQYKMDAPLALQMVLVQMVFQMGKAGVSKFKNTLTAMANKEYSKAAYGMRNSLWYRQTTGRAEKMAKIVEQL